MSGTIRGFRDYLLNPYVLLVSGAWTFDAIMVLGLVLAVYYLQKGKLVSSGLALAFRHHGEVHSRCRRSHTGALSDQEEATGTRDSVIPGRLWNRVRGAAGPLPGAVCSM